MTYFTLIYNKTNTAFLKHMHFSQRAENTYGGKDGKEVLGSATAEILMTCSLIQVLASTLS